MSLIDTEDEVYESFLREAKRIASGNLTPNGNFKALGNSVSLILKRKQIRLAAKALQFNIAKTNASIPELKCKMLPTG